MNASKPERNANERIHAPRKRRILLARRKGHGISVRSVQEGDQQTVPVLKKNLVALLERALEHSQAHRLDFFFRHQGFDETSGERSDEQLLENKVMNQCFDLLLTHSKRWRSIELIIPPPLLSHLSLVHGKVNQIEDVYLTCTRNSAPARTIDAFEIAPKLQNFFLEDMHPDVDVLFPTDNLVSFVDGRRLPDHDTAPKYVDIIASAHNLLEFSYHHYSLIPESPGPYSPPIPNASLQVLSASLGTFLSSLVLPNLTDLTLTSGCKDDGTQSRPQAPIYCPRDSLSHLHSLITVSQCSLTELRFVDATMDDNLLPILRLCPRLVILDFVWNLWGTSLSSQFVVHRLVIEMSETIQVEEEYRYALLPCLKELKFDFKEVPLRSITFLGMDDFVDMETDEGLQVLRWPVSFGGLEYSMYICIRKRYFNVYEKEFKGEGGSCTTIRQILGYSRVNARVIEDSPVVMV
ncbi:hypothetical protein ARMGADRAFT_1040667 [Armillaria gallica]|uniref:F-box domain-containing protein n=1 Tax=Armillaria gallica TaxID=47427 RepID=A0A2H3CMH8_ARMGA|nr:hypothetical protein ARMGADRAFT_1040667 [Armillaria gallica]